MNGQTYDLLIIGGGPAGHSAAHGYRKAGGDGSVRLLSADTEPPYNRPPLSKEYLRGEADDADLPIEDLCFYSEHDITVSPRATVARLAPQAGRVYLSDGRSVGYGNCVLATGAEPVRPSIPGVKHPNVRQLRSADSGRLLRECATTARQAAVVGSGFIGCEAAVSLARRGLPVTLISTESVPQEKRLGKQAGAHIAAWLKDEGVRLLSGSSLHKIVNGRELHTDTSDPVHADLILLATGVQPRAGLAEKAGLSVQKGRIRADERMRTSAPGVLTAGDVSLAHNATAGRPLPVEHWGEALNMGELAGTTAAGGESSWRNAPGFWSVIGDRVLKYAAWGDGFDEAKLVEHSEEAFTVWYGWYGTTVGVLTHQADQDYERGTEMIESGRPLPN